MTHPVVVGDSDVHLEDLSRLEGFQDLPLAVGGAVDVGVVVAALPQPSCGQVRQRGERMAGQARRIQNLGVSSSRCFVLVSSPILPDIFLHPASAHSKGCV